MAGLVFSEVAGGSRIRKPVDEIPDTVIDTVDEVLATVGVNHRVGIDFETEDEAIEWLSDARAYAYQADPRLIITGNTTKGKKDGTKPQARFSVDFYEDDSAEDAA